MTRSPKNTEPRGGVVIGRREALLAGLGTGLGTVGFGAGPSVAAPRMAEAARADSTHGIVPADGAIAQTASLQAALDEAASSGTPLFLPAGTYKTEPLALKSGTHVHGVPGRTVLKSGGAPIFTAKNADNLRLSGLVFDGEHGSEIPVGQVEPQRQAAGTGKEVERGDRAHRRSVGTRDAG